MALIKCPNCGEEISSYSTKCVHCNAEIKKEKENSFTKEQIEYEDNENNTIIPNEKPLDQKKLINDVIDFNLILAKIVITLMWILIVITAIGCLALLETSDGISILYGIGLVIAEILSGLLTANNLRWKAYMLKLTNDIKNKED